MRESLDDGQVNFNQEAKCLEMTFSLDLAIRRASKALKWSIDQSTALDRGISKRSNSMILLSRRTNCYRVMNSVKSMPWVPCNTFEYANRDLTISGFNGAAIR